MTHRLDRSVAVRHLEMTVRRLRETGAEVVVGTCPDLGAVEPLPQPLRWLARRWSRDLAAAQTVAVVEAGGRAVSVGDMLGAAFSADPQDDVQRGPLPPERCRLRPRRRRPPAVRERRARPLRRAHHPDPPEPAARRGHRAASPRRRPAPSPTPAPRSLPPRSPVRPAVARAAGRCSCTASARRCRPRRRPAAGLARRRARRLRSRGRQPAAPRASARTPTGRMPSREDAPARLSPLTARASATAERRGCQSSARPSAWAGRGDGGIRDRGRPPRRRTAPALRAGGAQLSVRTWLASGALMPRSSFHLREVELAGALRGAGEAHDLELVLGDVERALRLALRVGEDPAVDAAHGLLGRRRRPPGRR